MVLNISTSDLFRHTRSSSRLFRRSVKSPAENPAATSKRQNLLTSFLLTMSRHELKLSHRRLNAECHLLRSQHKKMRLLLTSLHDGYIELYATFPLLRYGQLKTLIKKTVTSDNLEFVSSVADIANTADTNERVRLKSLLQVSKLDCNDPDIKKEIMSLTEEEPISKTKQAFRFLLKATGFDSEPIEDEDVMDNENLQRNIRTLKRDINGMYGDFKDTSSAFKLLKETYEDSKGSLFFLRYFTLKSNVRAVIHETKADTNYKID
ncbi:hypothetical protein BgiBS90_013505 [Biomphalaria glabrata]|nr:hypothetical protein BgiBS90_013505 [Biomphalaria glabrata]